MKVEICFTFEHSLIFHVESYFWDALNRPSHIRLWASLLRMAAYVHMQLSALILTKFVVDGETQP